MKEYLTAREVADFWGTKITAVHSAIKNKRIKADKVNKYWRIFRESVEEYPKIKYSRSLSWYKGELLFDKEKGEYSMKEVSRLLKVPLYTLYHYCRRGILKYQRKGKTYVLHITDINRFKEIYRSRRQIYWI